ncbi:MAG: hypothetical protein LC750_18820 [Actinobacteria bacterium]|nr:hypothetical protein [Actinomycetota bacterium]
MSLKFARRAKPSSGLEPETRVDPREHASHRHRVGEINPGLEQHIGRVVEPRPYSLPSGVVVHAADAVPQAQPVDEQRFMKSQFP